MQLASAAFDERWRYGPQQGHAWLTVVVHRRCALKAAARAHLGSREADIKVNVI